MTILTPACPEGRVHQIDATCTEDLLGFTAGGEGVVLIMPPLHKPASIQEMHRLNMF